MARFRKGKGSSITTTGCRFSTIDDATKIVSFDHHELFDKGREKDLIKYVRTVKSAMRKSDEYKRLMKFLKTDCELDHCGIHPNISIENGFKIEIHHTPFGAEPILLTVMKKRHENNESLDMCDILDEVMLLHYMKFIGLYPFDDLCHHYNHSEVSTLFVPNDKVFGDPEKFYEAYQDYMEDPLKNKWKNSEMLTDSINTIKDLIPPELYAQNVYILNKEGQPYLCVQSLVEYLTKLGVMKR